MAMHTELMSTAVTVYNLTSGTVLQMELLPDSERKAAAEQNGSDTDSFGVLCSEWLVPQHALFQVGYLCSTIAFLTPKTFAQHALLLRCVLISAYLFLFVWAATISCMPDCFGWNFAFFAVNIGQIVRIFYQIWPTQLCSELEDVYACLFQPFKVTRQQFKNLCKFSTICSLREGEFYAIEDVTVGDDRLSILLSGRAVTSCEGVYLHHVHANDFLDSPEWISITQGSKDAFLVSVRALSNCRYISWPRQKLVSYLSNEPFLAAVLDVVLGKDVASKMQVVKEHVLLQGWHQQDIGDSREKLHSGGYHSITSELSIIEEAITLLPGGKSAHGQTESYPGRRESGSVSFETNL
ncbi:blood vessel epicardial substance-like [Ptychodera flava]|uniref:blood vessel epicardial substance-like n=1 Tax=Ptychodera flava TaxID=63121 RepID=UPI00396A542E